MADQRRRAELLPSYSVHRTQNDENEVPVREFKNPAYVEEDGSQQKKISLPLPDYNTLFPQKRHGVQGQTIWDNLVSEFSNKHRDTTPELLGPEMSVDGPEEQPSPRQQVTQKNPAIRKYQETKPVSSKKVPAPAPPRQTASQVTPSAVDSSQRHGQKVTPQSLLRSSSPEVASFVKTSTTSSGRSKDGEGKERYSSAAATPTPRPSSRLAADTTPSDDQRKTQVTSNKEVPTAKPRQRVAGSAEAKKGEYAAKTNIQALSTLNMSSMNKKESEQELENRGPITDHSKTSDQEKPADPSADVNRRDSVKHGEGRKKDEHSNPGSPAFLRRNSSRKKILPSSIRSDNIFMAKQEPESKETTALPATSQVVSARGGSSASVPLQPESQMKAQSGFYGEEDPSPAEPFSPPSALPSSQPLSVLLEEPGPQAENSSGGKPLLKAWVSPSEAQPVSSGLGLSPRR